ncbi:hypothetical protein [Falsiruegeria mediterranea]|uniref:Uncharacterized protein n=1 Tax=Falsiruegeria mediterranea M17 TaxID=1200281 RepID=A0A2R8C3Y9_9RHOB|nr:hypothetical protein [Falsiruegeria mediterranea]SPJ27148.1 hypothetical protein TRM7615_00629 [Falsiruegeria mediterranea M17]
MEIEQSAPKTRRLVEVGQIVIDQNAPCLGCTTCRGVCFALAEVATLPEVVLRRGSTP